MADDTRQQPPMEAPTVPGPRPPANTMPGGSAHTAGGTPADGGVKVTYWEALKTIRPSDYLTFHKKPCVRDGQLTGIGTGFAFGGIAAVLRKPVYTCCSWAVWSYVSTSIIAYQWCQNQRAKERAGIREAMKIMEEKRQNVEAKREARRKAIEEARRLEEERKLAEQRRSWSFWAKNNLKFW